TDDSKIVGLSDGQKEISKLNTGETGVVVLPKTCFYAESGGQVGDTGRIKTADGEVEVLDCTKMSGLHLHQVKVVDGFVSLESSARLEVDAKRRRQIMNNHSATHLLHSALRQVLGEHVTQAGSLVAAE